MKKPPAIESEYPMRINKYLAQKGYSTRRGADELISRQRVFINNQVAELGSKVLEKDEVEVRMGKKSVSKKYYYFAYNKVKGVITHSARKSKEEHGGDIDETDIIENLPNEAHELGLFPVGRLDKDSHGLIILTNDGRITSRLLHPDKAHDKEYVVRTKLPLRPSFKKHMEEGVQIEAYHTRPCTVRLTGEHSFSIILTEGKKHQIRRMVVAMHNEVMELKRTRILNITLGTLKGNGLRPIEGSELEEFLNLLGLAGTPRL